MITIHLVKKMKPETDSTKREKHIRQKKLYTYSYQVRYLFTHFYPPPSIPPSPSPSPFPSKKKSTLHLLNPLQIIRILYRSIQLSRRGLLEQFPRLESNILRSRDLRFFGNFSLDHEGRAVHAFGAVFFVQAVQEIVLRCFAGGEGELLGFFC